MKNRAQVTLEFTLIFIITVGLIMGMLGLWKWSSDTIVQRQLKYNDTRVEAGSGQGPSGSTPLGFTFDEGGGSADIFKEGAASLSSLSLEQINAKLDSVNQSLADIQANMSGLADLRDFWEDELSYAEQQEAEAQRQVDDLEAQLAEAQQHKGDLEVIGYDEYGQPIYETYGMKIARLSEEIGKLKNGYYTSSTYVCDEGSCETITTYDYSNSRWMSRFGTREEWAQDYAVYRQYGISEGNNLYGLYNNYTPGLLDWQARKAYAQQQRYDAQANVDQAESVLAKTQAMQDQLQEAKESKSSP